MVVAEWERGRKWEEILALNVRWMPGLDAGIGCWD